MDFEAFNSAGASLGSWRVFSVGGGAIREESAPAPANFYPVDSMAGILAWHQKNNAPLWKLVEDVEGKDIWNYFRDVWSTMKAAIDRGLRAEGTLPGGLKLQRKAHEVFATAQSRTGDQHKMGLLSAYGLAVMEENASAGIVVTAPTCGACGVVPAVLRYCEETQNCGEEGILKALAVAGLVGNLVKTNASISGAEVGCQGEIGTACAMAAAAAAQILGGSPKQIEYAAEMGMEHHLGLTCDPVMGLVQIPCIERNVFAATRALDAAEYALLGDGTHRISFDQVVNTMKETGKALPSAYRETSQGGLAKLYAEHPM
jgi:L-serine dehydratase